MPLGTEVGLSAGHIVLDGDPVPLKLQCGPMPSVMAALPNIGGALCSMPQSLADAHYQWRAVTLSRCETPLKLAGVPQTRQRISAVSGPKFTMLWGHVEQILLFNKFFFRLSIRALVAKIWPDKVVHAHQDHNLVKCLHTSDVFLCADDIF